MKTSELTGATLDWAVTVCEEAWTGNSDRFMVIFKHQNETKLGYCWSTNWALSGPIIERENISITGTTFSWWECEQGWYAHIGDMYEHGDTPLIAATRCYVASKLGDEVDVPEELK